MSSDSSDDENLELLREAQDRQFINDSMFGKISEKSTIKKSDDEKKRTLPSLRTVIDEDQQFNFFKVSPELRNFVAKKLHAFLEEKLKNKFVDETSVTSPKKKHKKGGVKLFSDSENFLKISKNKNLKEDNQVYKVNKKRVDRYKKTEAEVSEDLLKAAVVTAEDIFGKKEVKNWSNRSKAPVYEYKKSPNGQLLLVESNSSIQV